MSKVSVIIPIYGVEKYIEQCACSLFEQTLDDMEFIFVNDCTKDNSIVILNNVLKRFPERIPQTKILHHPTNKGLPLARKTGIQVANGEYIAHCDSDDWIESTMYQDMFERAQQSDADIVVSDFILESDNKKTIFRGLSSEGNDNISNFLLSRNPYNIWNKLFRKDLFQNQNLIFPEDNMGEDFVIVLQIMLACKKIEYLPQIYYHYRIHKDSITQMPDKYFAFLRFQQRRRNLELIINIFKQHNLYTKYKQEFITQKFFVKHLIEPFIAKKALYKVWYGTYSEINIKVLLCPYIELLSKIVYLRNLTLYKIPLRNFKNKFRSVTYYHDYRTQQQFIHLRLDKK